jgi:hypothetical protein
VQGEGLTYLDDGSAPMLSDGIDEDLPSHSKRESPPAHSAVPGLLRARSKDSCESKHGVDRQEKWSHDGPEQKMA